MTTPNEVRPCEKFNIRIGAADLLQACRVLGDVHVVACGSVYATLETDEFHRRALSKAHIWWTID